LLSVGRNIKEKEAEVTTEGNRGRSDSFDDFYERFTPFSPAK
jgi:hypothetical protein